MEKFQKYMTNKYFKYVVYILYFIYFIYKRYLKILLKSLLFILILMFLLLEFQTILSVPKLGVNEQTGFNNIHNYPNSYDVCFVGRSPIISNISSQHLYEQYGITSVSAGVSGQAFPMTKYTLEEVLNYQSPKVVFLDTKVILDSDRIELLNYQDESYLHHSLDNIKTLSIKQKALKTIQKFNKEIDVWDYYSKLYNTHENWKNLTQKNFLGYDPKAAIGMNGNITYMEVADDIINTYSTSNNNFITPVTLKKEKYLSEMIDLCDTAGADLVLFTSYTSSTRSQHHAIKTLANKFHLKYLDINEFTLKTNFQHNLDLINESHCNLSGAIKITDFIGEFLQKNYNFELPNSSVQQVFEQQKPLFDIQKQFIYTKQDLLSATNFNKFLTELNNLDINHNLIFISIYNDAIKHLTTLEQKQLHELGLKTTLTNKQGCSYAAIISSDKIWEDFSYISDINFEGKIDNLSYEITSGGLKSGGRSSIMIDEKEASLSGRGFNFVIYNTQLEQVMISCFFDTSGSVNPAQSRYKATSTTTLQQETGPNIWENVE